LTAGTAALDRRAVTIPARIATTNVAITMTDTTVDPVSVLILTSTRISATVKPMSPSHGATTERQALMVISEEHDHRCGRQRQQQNDSNGREPGEPGVHLCDRIEPQRDPDEDRDRH
jgi:hypothetical protein